MGMYVSLRTGRHSRMSIGGGLLFWMTIGLFMVELWACVAVTYLVFVWPFVMISRHTAKPAINGVRRG